jgi:hypothetical protein
MGDTAALGRSTRRPAFVSYYGLTSRNENGTTTRGARKNG